MRVKDQGPTIALAPRKTWGTTITPAPASTKTKQDPTPAETQCAPEPKVQKEPADDPM